MSCEFFILSMGLLGFLTFVNFILDNFWGPFQLIHSLLSPYISSSGERRTIAERFGSWALITGSTDGIGKAYAFELAKRGINIILVSRNEGKLEKTAKEIESRYSVETKIIAADFSRGAEAIDVIKGAIGSIEVGILVNNVGKLYEYPAYLDEVPEKDLWDIMNINVGAVTMMCRTFIPIMKKRGRGAIVNVSSSSELQPLPFMAVYAATKAYVGSFTISLRYEYSKYGITIQHLSPFFVKTNMIKFSEECQSLPYIVPDADMFAKYAVFTLGKQNESTGYWTHGIQCFFAKLAPQWIRTYIGGQLIKYMRNEYLKKQVRKKSH